MFVIFAFSILLTLSALWMLATWPNLQMDELVFQLSQGIGGTGNDMIGQYMKTAGYPAAAVMILMALILFRFRDGRRLQRISLLVCAVCCLIVSGGSLYQAVNLGDYVVTHAKESEFIGDNYADPKEVSVVFPEQKRNLIYIFLESMEVTFADQASGGAFEKNVINELSDLAKENESFSGDQTTLNGAYSLPGTTWTMGGMFAATAGLPLQVSVGGNEMARQEEFFPNIRTLGDMLADEGYQNVLLIGSNADFGGRRVYFTSHGDYEMRDYNYAVDTGLVDKDYYVWWGYEDNKLISFAKDTLNELSSSDQPFNLTMLTVDTHFEDGYTCVDCPDTFGSDRYANAMACSSAKITEFIRWCQQQPWYENTTIVLSGDHPTMDRDFCDNVAEDYERKVYTAYINSAAENAAPEENRIYSTFDNFPTTLAAMGVHIEGDRLALGTNLFSGKETLSEQYGISDETALLRQKSTFMESMSGVSISAKDLYKNGNTLVNADVRITGYDPETGMLSIRADDILIDEGAVRKVRFIIENSSGTVFYDGYCEPDGSYTANLYIPSDQLSSTSLRVAAIYDRHGKISGGTVFGCSEGNLLYIGALQSDPAGYINFLNTLDSQRYSILMASQGNISAGMSDEVQQSLYNLGCTTDVKNSPDISYLFVKDDGSVLETADYSYLEWKGYLASLRPVMIDAAGESSGNTSSILINDGISGYAEYGPGQPGMNFVVWDNETNTSVSAVAFDTTQPLPDASVSFAQSEENPGFIEVNVSEIVNKADVASVYGVVFDETDPGRQMAFVFEQNEDGGYTAEFDGSDLDLETIHIRIMASDLSLQPEVIKRIDGNLNDYLS